MKTKDWIGITVSLTIAPLAWANSEGGVGTHGGNAVVCFADPSIAEKLTQDDSLVVKAIPDRFIKDIRSIEALDLHEGRKGQKPMDVVPIDPNESSEAYAERITSRFGGWANFDFGDIIRDGAADIVESIPVTDETLLPSNDIDPITSAGAGCVYATVIKQVPIGLSGKKRLIIDDRLYSHAKHSNLSKAVFLLHERVLANLGTVDGKTEVVRNAVANAIAQDVTMADLLGILGRRSEKTWPVPLAREIQQFSDGIKQSDAAELKSNWKDTIVPGLAGSVPERIRTLNEQGDPYVSGMYASGCALFRAVLGVAARETGKKRKYVSLSEEDCAVMNRLSGKAEKLNDAYADDLHDRHLKEWESRIPSLVQRLKEYRITEAKRAKIVSEMESWDPIRDQSLTEFYFDDDEVLYPF